MKKKSQMPIESFNDFIQRMQAQGLLTDELIELCAIKTSNRIQDNADNQLGAPALGSGTGVVLQGQMHEFTGSIADYKALIAKHFESLENNDASEDVKAKEHHQSLNPPTPYKH